MGNLLNFMDNHISYLFQLLQHFANFIKKDESVKDLFKKAIQLVAMELLFTALICGHFKNKYKYLFSVYKF